MEAGREGGKKVESRKGASKQFKVVLGYSAKVVAPSSVGQPESDPRGEVRLPS